MNSISPTAHNPKKKNRKKLFVRLTLVVIILLFGVQFIEGRQMLQQKQQEKARLQEALKIAYAENDRLTVALQQLDSQDYIERVAREELGLVKEGEILIITVE